MQIINWKGEGNSSQTLKMFGFPCLKFYEEVFNKLLLSFADRVIENSNNEVIESMDHDHILDSLSYMTLEELKDHAALFYR